LDLCPVPGGSGQPDLQIRFVPGYALDPDAIQSYVRFGQLKAEGKKWPAGVTMQLLTARPRSRGSVGLKSTNPFDLPAVDINYFSDKDGADLATLVSGVKIAREIAAKSPLGSYLSEEGWPGAAVQTGGWQVEEWLLDVGWGGGRHPAGAVYDEEGEDVKYEGITVGQCQQ
jgi:choline dehydrogenase-like flavoprotein